MILFYEQNLFYTLKLQKQVYDKEVKSKNYILGKKVQLNSKYIRRKQNQKFEVRFFDYF